MLKINIWKKCLTMKKPINKKAFVINTLRRASYRWPSRTEALKKARVSRGQYQCKLCGPSKLYNRHDISADHVLPIVDPNTGWQSWDSYIERIFCDEPGFQILCDTHHSEKTAGENKTRKRTRDERKADRKKTRAKAKKRDPKTNKHAGQSLDEFLKECGINLDEKKNKTKGN